MIGLSRMSGNVTDREWQRADSLDAGDLLLSAEGLLVGVDGLDPLSIRTAAAYNLTVDDIHTYYVLVGDHAILVHNTCSGPRGMLSTVRSLRDAGLSRAERRRLIEGFVDFSGEGSFFHVKKRSQLIAETARSYGLRLPGWKHGRDQYESFIASQVQSPARVGVTVMQDGAPTLWTQANNSNMVVVRTLSGGLRTVLSGRGGGMARMAPW